MASGGGETVKSKGFTDKKDYARFPERWKDKTKYKDVPADWNAPAGEALDEYRKPRKGQMANISWDMLEYEELPVSSAPLISAAQFIGVACEEQNRAFLVCKRETRDPRACLEKGRMVTDCARSFLHKVRDHCRPQFRAHWSCMDLHNLDSHYCAKFQTAFDGCVLEHTGLERPRPPPRNYITVG